MPFKRKSKKVFRKRSRRERSHRERSHRERSNKNINKNRSKKRYTRKILYKKRHTRKGGMVESDVVESDVGEIGDQESKKHPREDPYAVYDSDSSAAAYSASSASSSAVKTPELKKLRLYEKDLDPTRNTKLGFRQGEYISSCILGPDFLNSEAYQKMLKDFSERLAYDMKNGIKTLNTVADDPYEAFKVIKKNIEELRSGKVRCDLGPYKISEFPRYRSPYLLQKNKRLKFVVVKDFATKEFIILMAYAYMPNHNYTEEYLLKWTEESGEGIMVRTIEDGPKIVQKITPQIIQKIEEYCRQIGQELEWNSLLMTRSINPALYKEIIERYFSSKGDISNTAFLTSIDEISHSALANNFKGRGKKLVEDSFEIPLVFLGAEGVFYNNAQGKQCFIICNLSGHFKTPKERMDILRLILNHNYGYVNEDDPDYEIRELAPIPLASASSSSSQDSDERRPDYRDCLTNDPNIINFLQALEILNRADTTPIQGEVYTPYSAPTAHYSYRHALASSPTTAALAAAAPFELRSTGALAASAVNSRSSRTAARTAASAVNSRSSRRPRGK